MNIDEKYKRGLIYTIRNIKDDTLIYVGSTINTLSKRFDGHKRHCKSGYTNISLYNYIENNDWTDWYIELYEQYSCDNKKELDRREGQVIREIGTINKCIAGRTQKEYYEENIDKKKEYYKQNVDRFKKYRGNNVEKIKEYDKEYREQNADKIKVKQKEYREQNADKIKEYHKEYYEENADKIKEYREQNADKIKKQRKEYCEENADKFKEQRKEYRKQNADKIKEYREQNADKIKEYREQNADKIKEQKKEKVCCNICGILSRKSDLARHQKTKKCMSKNLNNTYIYTDIHI